MSTPVFNPGVILYNNSDTFLICNSNHNQKNSVRETSKDIFKILSLINGKNSQQEIASLLSVDLDDVQKVIDEQKRIDSKLFYQAPAPKGALEEVIALKKKSLEYKNVSKAPDLDNYHTLGITDAPKQFNQNEMTMSHLYRVPTKGLNGMRYGEALAKKLVLNLDETSAESINILEIGGGLGYLAFYFLEYLAKKKPSIFKRLDYTILDLSPELQRFQKETNKAYSNINFICANIQTHNFCDQKYDLIISNEMIADLDVEVANKSNCINGKPSNESEKLIIENSLKVMDFPEKFIFNLEAIRLIFLIKRILKANGIAFVSEYGTMNEPAFAVPLPGHFEYSIQFSHLEDIAKKIFDNSNLTTVYDYLSFDGESLMIANEDRATLFGCLMPYLGKEELPALAYDKELLLETIGEEVYNGIKNLQFYKLHENKTHLNPKQFYALLLKN